MHGIASVILTKSDEPMDLLTEVYGNFRKSHLKTITQVETRLWIQMWGTNQSGYYTLSKFIKLHFFTVFTVLIFFPLYCVMLR